MSKYELMLIVNPTISEEDRNSNLEGIKKLLNSNGKITKEDIWGEKKLAYKINKSERGFYILYELDLDGSKIKEINGSLNLNGNVWRYMFVKQDEA